jgi:hypothetical protein
LIGEYIVTLQGTEIRVDVVEADSAIEAARQLSVEHGDPRQSVYTVQSMVRLAYPVRVTI